MILRLWNRLSHLGVHDNMPKPLRQKIVLGNQISFTAAILVLLLSINFRNQPPQALTYISGFLMCVLFLFFNAINKHYLARITILVILPLLIIAGGFFSSVETRASQKLSLTLLIIVPLVLFGITEKRAMIIGLIWTLICIVAYDYIHLLLPKTTVYFHISPDELKLFKLISVLMNVIIFSLAFIYLQRLNHDSEASLNTALETLTQQNQRIEEQKNDLERANKKLEILNLRTRINPHFLYNALNSIQYFITANDKKSGLSYLTSFSRLMRKYLSYDESGLITLVEEIELLTNYLELEKLRFEDRFEYTIEVSDKIDTETTQLPFLLIQPFAENAILHGLVGKKNRGLLNINFSLENEYLICDIRDNGIGRTAAKQNASKKDSQSKGISLSLERLNLHYNYKKETNPITINDLLDDKGTPLGTHVRVKIPI